MSLPPYFRAEVVDGALEVEWLRGPVESVPLGLALAAPELVAVLRELVRAVDSQFGERWNNNARVTEALDAADECIAKATGGKP